MRLPCRDCGASSGSTSEFPAAKGIGGVNQIFINCRTRRNIHKYFASSISAKNGSDKKKHVHGVDVPQRSYRF